jgi:hypothetical protein
MIRDCLLIIFLSPHFVRGYPYLTATQFCVLRFAFLPPALKGAVLPAYPVQSGCGKSPFRDLGFFRVIHFPFYILFILHFFHFPFFTATKI